MFKKLAMVAAGCICTLAFAVTASADTVSVGKVNADALNVRPVPSTDSVSMGLLPTDSEVIILGTENNWYKIVYGDSTAYVSADYVIVTATGVEYTVPAPAPAPAQPVAIVTDPNVPSYVGSTVPGEVLVETAKQFIGTPYVYGGMSPAGFDCSGFVKYCYSLMGVELNRVAADQALNGVEVPADQMLPGDILCFSSSVGGEYIGHSGIYVGGGYFIHSPRTGYTVEIVPLATTSYGMRIKNVRRIF